MKITTKKDFLTATGFDGEKEINEIVSFLKGCFSKSPRQRAIIGVSGGIDSAVTLSLLVKSIGAENILALNLPYQSISSSESIVDSASLCKSLGVKMFTHGINDMVDAYFTNILRGQSHRENLALRRGNVCARARMIHLFDYSTMFNGMVVGTENKTEKILGFCTIGGDNISIIEPVIKFYKTEIFELAKHLGVPAKIIKKTPTAELWVGQTDEKELGFSYWDADRIFFLGGQNIYNEIKENELVEEIHLATDIPKEEIIKIIKHARKMKFKQEIPYCYE